MKIEQIEQITSVTAEPEVAVLVSDSEVQVTETAENIQIQILETATNIDISESSLNVEVVESPIVIQETLAGVQGATGPQGIQGIQGIQGPQGVQGEAGEGLAAGGLTGQFLKKNSNTDYDTAWADVPDPDISNLVPYTGATANVDLGARNLTANAVKVLNSANNSVVIGDITGDARGTNSLDFQQSRLSTAQVASGLDSLAIGRNSTAAGRNSVAIGAENSVSTTVLADEFYPVDENLQSGIAIGKGNTISASDFYSCYAIAIGRNNLASKSAAVSIGQGNNASASSTSAIGQNNTASAQFASAYGHSNNPSGVYSFAAGYGNEPKATNAMAIGQTNGVFGTNSFAIGVNNKVLGSTKCGAIGFDLVPVNQDAIAIGSGANFLTVNATSLSTPGNETPNERLHSTGNVLASNITSLGAEKLTNGTFTGNANGWTVGSFAYSGNKITKTADGTSPLTQAVGSMASALVVGEYYLLTFSLSLLTVGSIAVSCGGVNIATIAVPAGSSISSKAASFVFKCTSALAPITFTPSNTSRVLTIDNISLKKITGGNLIGLGGLYLGQDDTNRMAATVSSSGLVTFEANGASAGFNFNDPVQASSFKSADGSAGATGSFTCIDRNAITIKNGIVTNIAAGATTNTDSGWSISGAYTTRKSIDPTNYTQAQLLELVCTLIDTLKQLKLPIT